MYHYLKGRSFLGIYIFRFYKIGTLNWNNDNYLTKVNSILSGATTNAG